MKNQRINAAQPRLGIDIGRVIICPTADDGRPDTSFLGSSPEQALEIAAAPGALTTISRLVRAFDARVWLVSKAGQRIQQLTLLWLEHHEFYATTGLPRDHVRFCRRRHEKREHALELGLSHFIDDRLDVLGHLRGAVPELYLFGWQPAPAPDWVQSVGDWSAVARALLSQSQEFGRDVLGQPDAVSGAVKDVP